MTECADIILLFCKEILGKLKRRCFRVQQKQSQKQKLYFALECLDIVTHSFFISREPNRNRKEKKGRKKEGYQINGLVFDFLEADGLIAAHRRSSSNCEFLTIPLQEWTIYIYVKFEDILKIYIKMTKRNFSESHNRRWHLD